MRLTVLLLLVATLLAPFPASAEHSNDWTFLDLGVVVQNDLDVPMDLNDQAEAAYRQIRPGKDTRLVIHSDGLLRAVTIPGLHTILSMDDEGCVTGLLEDSTLFRYCFESGLALLGQPCEAVEYYHTNAQGDIAAQCSTSGEPDSVLLIRDGEPALLDDFGYGVVSVTGLNDRCDIIGQAVTQPGISRAFLIRDGRIRELGTLGGPGSVAKDINNQGVIVGDAQDEHGLIRSFVWDGNRGLEALTPPGVPSSSDQINEDGVIIGNFQDGSGFTRGFLLSDAFHPLSPFAMPSSVMDLNGQGMATGIIRHPDGRPKSGFLHARGMLYAIPCLPHEDIFLTPLPDGSDVVGTIWLSDGNSYAFHYSPVFGFSPLSRFIGVDHSWQIINIQAINSRGDLMGIAYNFDGELHAYLLTRK